MLRAERCAPPSGPRSVATKPADPSEDERSLPTIRIVAGEIPRMVQESIAALAVNAPNIYQRSGELVSVVREPDRKEPDHDVRTGSDILLRPGTPRLRRVPYTALLESLAVAATWSRFDLRKGKKVKGKCSGEWTTTNPDHLIAQIVAERADWPGIRPVRSILETPSFAPGGRLISSPGYDEETGVVLIPSCEMAPILEEPSQEHARRALQYLWVELFSDFPYRGIGEPGDDDTDRCKQYEAACRCPDAFVAIAALLTLLARHAIEGSCPGFVFEAATQGSGKSLQINVVSIVATGRAAGMMTLPVHDGHVDEAELDKVIGSYALAGARLVAFDNIKGSLGGQRLEAAITANPTVSCRVLGASDVRDLPWSAIVMFSGNNMTMSDDVSQRVLVSRIESPREDPRGRPDQSFRHRDLVASVRQLRPSLLQAALTVLRAFFVAHDKPDTGTWGSFEAWSRIVPPAIAYAGGPNVIECRASRSTDGQDSEGAAHRSLMRLWPSQYAEGVKAGELVTKAFERECAIQRGLEPPDGLDDFRAAIRTLTHTPEGKNPNSHAFGKALGGLRGAIRDGLKLVGQKDRNHVMTWRVASVGR